MTDPAMNNSNGNGVQRATLQEVYRAVDALRGEIKSDLNRLFDLLETHKTDMSRIERDLASLQARLATITAIISLLIPIAAAALIRAFIE
jgi:hypothetical protein